ncbi:MAG: hypothetical protein P9L99_21195 [Candidatus Lernaella stagnicola]|nr:hypothetical protein [Candidatus Lernaella stagnicola]
MEKEQKKNLLKEFGIAGTAWLLFLLAVLFATAAEEFTYAMF